METCFWVKKSIAIESSRLQSIAIGKRKGGGASAAAGVFFEVGAEAHGDDFGDATLFHGHAIEGVGIGDSLAVGEDDDELRTARKCLKIGERMKRCCCL